MTKEEIAERLLKLSYDMQDISTHLSYYGGFAPWAKHAEELAAGASVVKQWGWEVLNDSK